MAAVQTLSLLVAVLLTLRCLGQLDADSKLLHAVEDGDVQFDCLLPSSTIAAASLKTGVKLLRLTKATSNLVYERHGGFPASLGNGYFNRLSLKSFSTFRHQFKLTGLSEADKGSYACTLELDNGESCVKVFYLKLWLLPKFESSFNSTVFYRQSGEYIVLRCPKFRGRPQPTVVWLVNERRLTNHGRFRIDPLLPEQLQVYNLNQNDSGRYSCRIENDNGSSEFDFTLLVGSSRNSVASIAFIHRPPPSQATALEGDRFELPCGYHVDLRLRQTRVVWQRRRTNSELWSALSEQSNYSTVLVAQTNGSLIFLPLDHSNSGIYRCLVILVEADGSERQLTSNSATLTVLYRPVLLENASLVQFLPLGLPGSLSCPMIANPPIGATEWYRDGQPIGAAFFGSRFRFNLVTPSHAGSYRCRSLQTTSSLNSWSSWTPEFEVKTVQPPRFITRPLPLYQLVPGESTRLPCTFWSPPDVVVSLVWLYNRDRLNYQDQRLAYDPLGQALLIRDIQPHLAGTYTCVLDNPVNSLAFTTRLIVELVSPHPPSNLTVVSLTSYSLSLVWQPAFVAGHSMKYIVWYRRSGSAWESQQVGPTSATEATVAGLFADTEYELSLTSVSSGGSLKEMRVQPEVTTARTSGYSPQLAQQPLPRDRSGRPVFPPIERDLGPRPGPPEAATFAIVDAGVLKVSWQPPAKTQIPVLYYRLEVSVTDDKVTFGAETSWETLKQVLEPQASLSIYDLPLLRLRVTEAVTTQRRLHVAATACALLSRSQRVIIADVHSRQLSRLFPAGSVAAAVAASGVNRVPAGAAWALLSCLLSFLVLAGALLGLTRSTGRSLGRRVVVVNGVSEKLNRHSVGTCESLPALRQQSQQPQLRRHRCRTRRCCCRQQASRSGKSQIGASGVSSEHPALLTSSRRLDRRASDPESGFHSYGGVADLSRDDSSDDDDLLDANDDDVSVSDIESTLPPGSWQVHGWSRRLPISVYLASYHRIRRLRRASCPVYRESDLL